jgi:hypothetical protein
LPFLDLTRCFLDPTVSDGRNSSLLLRFTRPSKVFERFSNRRPSTSLSAFSAAKKKTQGGTNQQGNASESFIINQQGNPILLDRTVLCSEASKHSTSKEASRGC